MSVTKPSSSFGGSLAPPPDWGDHDHTAHVVQFYAEDSFLLESLSRFIGTALGGGDLALVVATPAHREGLARILRSQGLDISGASKAGRYIALDAAETLTKFMVDDWPDAARFTETIGGFISGVRSRAVAKDQRLAVFGEMVSLLWAQGKLDAAFRLEQLWTELSRIHSFSLRCGYPIKHFDRHEHGELFLKICSEHTGVIPNESYTALANEEHRLRNITHLQQRAEALENEIAERKRAECDLRAAHDSLERRVHERTIELQQKNIQIRRQSETLEVANRGLRELSSRLLRVQDEERRRIARDLHDSTGQILALLSMNLSALETEAQGISPELAKSISENTEIVNQVSSELRTMSYLLYPPLLDEMGLLSALRWFCEGFEQRSGIKVQLDLVPDFGRVSRDLETAIFRIIQESLTNIHRHAESSLATIRLSQSFGNVRLQIEDQGKGISREKLAEIASAGVSGVGLRGMRERVENFCGQFEVSSSETGTCIAVTIPLSAAEAAG
jgi:signal transduction histidine kinase